MPLPPSSPILTPPRWNPALLPSPEALGGVATLLGVIAHLRDPENGCPWDLKQTHESLRPFLLEEAYEAVERMADPPSLDLKEELGDVLLQVLLHAQLAKDSQHFDFEAICQTLSEKLIRRHPHVFLPPESAPASIENPEQVSQQWEAIKQEEAAASKTATSQGGLFSKSYGQLPALLRAQKISKKAVKAGFAWPDFQALWDCVQSEYEELNVEIQQKAAQARLEDELGDCLFATVSLAQHLNVDAEVALTGATEKFLRRFKAMEAATSQPLETLSFEEWDRLWNQAKRTCASSDAPAEAGLL